MADYIVRATAAGNQIQGVCSNDQGYGRRCKASAQYKSGSNGCSGTAFDSRNDDGKYDEE